MEKQDWVDTFNKSKTELRALVERFHPAVTAKVEVAGEQVELPASVLAGNFPITASGAEAACESVRQEIQAKYTGSPLDRFDAAAEKMDTRELTSLLNDVWFGMPESASVREVPGFHVLCDLCEGVDDDGEEEGDEEA
jgi:hypothetical protein